MTTTTGTSNKAVEDMDIDELKALIAERYSKATRTGLLTACAEIADELGTVIDHTYRKCAWEDEANDIRIFHDSYGGYLTVHVKGRQVCSTHSTKRFVVPGSWQGIVYRTYQDAVKKKEARDAARIAEQRAELLRMIEE